MREAAGSNGRWDGRFTPFDASEFLDSEEAIAEYLAAALAEPDPDVMVAKLDDIAKLRIARQASAPPQIDASAPYRAKEIGR